MRAIRDALWIARKDLAVWIRRPIVVITTLTPSLMYIAVVYFISVSIGRAPVALIVLDQGPRAAQLAASMRSFDGLTVTDATPARAAQLLNNLTVAAVVTIPQGFDSSLAQGHTSPVRVELNNVNLDIADDIRRALPSTVVSFYAQSGGGPLPITVRETDVRPVDISLAQFRILPSLVLILTIAGVVNSGLATSQEFETFTIKELMLSPASLGSILAGKVLAGWATTVLVGAVVLAIGALSGLVVASLTAWAAVIGLVLLLSLASASLGVALGAALRRFQLVTSLGVAISLYLFFLSGGVSVPGFLPDILSTTSHLSPLFYGMDALEKAVLDNSFTPLRTDVPILVAFVAVTTLLARASFRRQLAR